MTRTIASLVVLAVLAPVFAQEKGADREKIYAETRTVADFDELEFRLAGDLKVRFGKPASVKIDGDEDVLPLITTEVHKRRLVIAVDELVRDHDKLDFLVTVPDLKLAKILGAGDLRIHGLDNKAFAIEVDGSADVVVSGKTEQLSVKVTGSGDVTAFKLKVPKVSVAIKGSGDVRVSPSESLTVNISGSGDVHYTGDPQITQAIHGSGDVKKVTKIEKDADEDDE